MEKSGARITQEKHCWTAPELPEKSVCCCPGITSLNPYVAGIPREQSWLRSLGGRNGILSPLLFTAALANHGFLSSYMWKGADIASPLECGMMQHEQQFKKFCLAGFTSWKKYISLDPPWLVVGL